MMTSPGLISTPPMVTGTLDKKTSNDSDQIRSIKFTIMCERRKALKIPPADPPCLSGVDRYLERLQKIYHFGHASLGIRDAALRNGSDKVVGDDMGLATCPERKRNRHFAREDSCWASQFSSTV